MDRYRIKEGQKVLLKDFDPNDRSGWDGDKDSALAKMTELRLELDGLQELLYAENKHRILFVLQGMDTAGKDGTTRSVFDGTNPQGVQVASFKEPSAIELAHDYLWRIHERMPANGEIVIFNRSHYENLLIVRVHNLVPEETWKKRFDHINDFEKMLVDEGTTIVKFFLHIDLKTQKERLLERLEDPKKQWKLSASDIPERKLWPEYMKAYEEVLSKTSTEYAPWYWVPSNHNWYRNLVMASVVVKTLKDLNPQYPPATEDLKNYRAQLEME
ncbi:MAG TPA: polyphosphate kinase 2 family protein [Anaerolineaceae bacterium]|nr:polyphosphate kinase 2 family protein [Anaerolineaceae bacterium]